MEGSSASRGLIESGLETQEQRREAQAGTVVEFNAYSPVAPHASNIVATEPVGVYAAFGKRMFDVVFSAVFLLTLGFWLLPLIALLIRLDSSGPVLFRQLRVGKDGELFRCLKFRSMSHDPGAKFAQAQKNDGRITRVGRVLRKTNLDELPQFINVLCGHMSIVGPRPHVPELDRLFEGMVPGYGLRTATRPGVTGLAQVSGCRGETRSVREMTHRIRFDLFYSRNVGLLMDLKIIVATVWCALAGDRKAY